MTPIGEALDEYLRGYDARYAFHRDGDFHALVWALYQAHEGRDAPPDLSRRLDAELPAALERVYDLEDRIREAIRRPPGPRWYEVDRETGTLSLLTSCPDRPGWPT